MDNSYISLLITAESDEKIGRIMDKVNEFLKTESDIIDFEWRDI